MNGSDSPTSPAKSSAATRSNRWRRARRLLVCLLALSTLTAAFYTVENWRGKRAWEHCKSELEARGAVLDWSAYVPPPVPAEQNFFDAPKMTEWFVKPRPGQPGRYVLRGRLANTNTLSEITTEAAARDYLAWSDQFESEFKAIREALKRPYAHIGGAYSRPFVMPLPNFVNIRSVAQTLAQRAKCHLLLDQPAEALGELTFLSDLCRVLENRPAGKPMFLVAAIIEVALTGLYVETVADGVRLKAWREPQLVAIQKTLRDLDLLALVASSIECERAAVCRTLEMSTPRELGNIFSLGETRSSWQKIKDPKFLLLATAPRGWVFQNMACDATLLQRVLEGYDLANHVVSPEKINRAGEELENLSRFSPYTFLASMAIPNFIRATQTTARNQTKANEAYVVCALERYRLAHRSLPDSLEALVPEFIEKLPHDIISGGPLKYRRTADGTFLLYSIGWNEADDGGTIGRSPAEGDWVWRYPAEP